jgi:hypothetical protein
MRQLKFILRQFPALVFALVFSGGASRLPARDAFVMLSGGDSPMANNFSQYLQAKAVATWLEQNYPRDSVWIFFGAGNVEGATPVFGDVRREIKRDGLTLDSWLPGSLPRNLPAQREVILRKLREEILPAVAGGGTLYLFVGDHGSRTRGSKAESIINLWSLERDPRSDHGWRSNDKETLGVSELRRVLADGLGQGKIVFCMTQCHAGGFHFLAVPREMTPNPKWFARVPGWASPKEQPVFARAAGFTATDERSMAAGCDADPDPMRWQGYERFVPENLLGLNLFTLEKSGRALESFADAHIAATLVDRTIDKPYSTSEQYLERWATLIETRLAKDSNLTDKTKKWIEAYEQTVNGKMPRMFDRSFNERQSTFSRLIDRLTEQNWKIKSLLVNGTRKELEEAIDPPRRSTPDSAPRDANNAPDQPRPRGGRRGGAFGESRRLWSDTLRPAWTQAVNSQASGTVPAGALDFEKYLLAEEGKGRDFFFGGGRSRIQEEVFWQSGYSNPATMDAVRAEAVARWGVERRSKILAWAKNSDDAAIRGAAERISQLRPPRPQNADSTANSSVSEVIAKDTAAERTLFYRRVLAAWEFLLRANERPALDRIRELTELERTPLPSPKAR